MTRSAGFAEAVPADVDSGMRACMRDWAGEVMMTHYEFHCDACLTPQSSPGPFGVPITPVD